MKENNEIRKEENKKAVKSVIALVIIVSLIIFGVFIVRTISDGNTIDNKNIEKASEIFGDEYCQAIMHIATKDSTQHMCKICGKEFKDSGMREDICDQCAKETDRCNFCGKKLSEDIKKQRENLTVK